MKMMEEVVFSVCFEGTEEITLELFIIYYLKFIGYFSLIFILSNPYTF